VRLILVRHGHAGRKDQWPRADKLRPLDPRGHRQAVRLVDVLMPLKPTRIISSGHLRCLQTMQPLAALTGLEMERSGALAPDSVLEALALVRDLSGPPTRSGTVLCTHGEVLGIVLKELAAHDGVALGRRPPGLKGCVWILEMRRRKLTSAEYVPPPVSKR
jgi:8-oxo-(d)GTP phosphatase